MAEPLEVDPADLFMSADHLDMHQSDHDRIHSAANSSIESVGPGWVGSSGIALQSKLTHLQAVTDHISTELGRHRDAFRRIGHSYQNLDEDDAAHILRVRDSL